MPSVARSLVIDPVKPADLASRVYTVTYRSVTSPSMTTHTVIGLDAVHAQAVADVRLEIADGRGVLQRVAVVAITPSTEITAENWADLQALERPHEQLERRAVYAIRAGEPRPDAQALMAAIAASLAKVSAGKDVRPC